MIPIVDYSGRVDETDIKRIQLHVNHQLVEVCRHWPGAHRILSDLIMQNHSVAIVERFTDPALEGALGYHDVDDKGNSIELVSASAVLDNGGTIMDGSLSLSGVISHEECETLGNPIINVMRQCYDEANSEVAQELCDPVENSGYTRGGVWLSNYVLPAWFNPWGQRPFDALGNLFKPFQIERGGYAIVAIGGEPTAVWGDEYPDERKQLHSRAKVMGVEL